MKILSLFVSRNIHRSEEKMPVPLEITPAPLCLPEILSLILSFLPQHTIKHSARYVCRLWLAASRPLTNVHAVWHSSCQETDRHYKILDNLHLITTLCIRTHRYWLNGRSKYLWDRFSERIDHLNALNQIRITRLDFVYVANLATMVYPLLSKIGGSLTKIYITNLSDCNIHVEAILALCPRLFLLHVDNRWKRVRRITDSFPSWYETLASVAIRDNYSIEHLIIRGMGIEQHSMQAILQKCPQLQVLKMDQILFHCESAAEPFDQAMFFASVAKSCRHLKYFHLSVCGHEMSPQDAAYLVQFLYPGVMAPARISNSTLAPQLSPEQPYPQQLYLDTVSVSERETNKATLRTLFRPFLESSFDSIITVLEIVPAIDQVRNDCLTHALHGVLCSASSLLHVRASTVAYFVEYLEFSEAAVSDRLRPLWSCVSECLASEHDFKKKRVWACRRLRTLQLKFISKTRGDENRPEYARMMFGYIAKVCPNLRELSIYRLRLNLELEGGLCLLSRLRFLQRLTVVTWTKSKMKKKDLEWMARHPPEKVILQLCKWSNISLSPRKNDDMTKYNDSTLYKDASITTELTVESLKDVGSVTNWKACLKQIEQGMNGEGCWPMLEFLGLRHSEVMHHSGHYLPIIIANIRPGVEFSCNYEELLQRLQ
ncbi:hypothetical protein BGX27_007818 [Mortierella sp. AM989]|nr:hypothetical protein BGX27_007818 [Mortierella sp. AM989]